ncbi:MAG TPA: PAS domain S-box protein, partial [Gemmatimonadales bacterium]|nr:PAS domain S-box protein [Gemmatimonadales bacterium]
ASGEGFSLEYRARHKDGGYRWVLDRARVVRDEASGAERVVGMVIDVTERKKVEEALRHERARLQAILQHLPEGVIIAEAPSGRLLLGNEQVQRIWRRPFVAAGGIAEYDTYRGFHPDGRPYQPHEWPLARTVTTGEVVEQEEIRIQRGDDSFGWVGVSSVPIHDAAGRVIAGVVTFADITERKQAEAALRESEARFRNMADHAPVPIWVTDVEGRCIYLNRRWYELTGQSEATALGFGWLDAIHPDDRPVTERAFVEAAAARRAFRLEYRLRRHDGAYRRVIDAAGPRFGPGGEFLGYVGSVLDVTDHKLAEEAARRQSELTQTVLENSTAALFMMDRRGHCIYMNRAAEAMFGWTFEEIGRQPLHDVIHHHRPDGRPYPMAECPIDRALPEHFDIREHEDVFIRKNGEFFPVLVAASPIFDEMGRPASTVIEVRDITERKRAEAAIREANRELERRVAERTATLRELNDQLAAFSYSVSHDLRAPVRAIRGYIEALLEDCGPELGEVGRDYARRIAQAAQHMNRLCEDLLQLARLTRQEVELVPTELATAVREALAQLEEGARGYGARLEAALDGAPPVLAHPATLVQALANLLSNARKFVAPGVTPRVRVWAQTDGAARPRRVRVWVEDNGIGIDPRYHDRIFEGFERLHPAGVYPGTGVGLAIVRRGLERMGGRVGVESAPGEGSRFWIELPVALAT